MKTVRVDISGLRLRAGERVMFSFCEPIADGLPEGVSLAGPVKVEGAVLNTGPAYLVDGEIGAAVEATCSRCLASFRQEVETPFREEFREGVAPSPGKEEVSEESGAEVWFFQGDALDLTEAVRQNLLLALPSQPLCRPDCPGLCPVCGRRLAEGSCSCRVEEIDPRLEALRRFLPHKEE
ncbi:MAG: DUF177 domain-containing protein [Bacillota bacterium]